MGAESLLAGISPWTMLGSAAIGGIGSFFGASAEEQAAEKARQMQEAQLAFKKQQWADQQAGKKNASGIIGSGYNTAGYGQTLNYVNPYQGAIDTSINAFLSGGLMPAEIAQQGKDIAAGSQNINANAATMGLTAGGRAALQNQNVSNITGNYANLASGRIGTGIGAATNAASTGANIANMNYQTGLNNFLQQQQANNQKMQLMGQYAT
jgi:hypothetical protein